MFNKYMWKEGRKKEGKREGGRKTYKDEKVKKDNTMGKTNDQISRRTQFKS